MCVDFLEYDDYVVYSSTDDVAISRFLEENGCEIKKDELIEKGNMYYPFVDKYSGCVFKIV